MPDTNGHDTLPTATVAHAAAPAASTGNGDAPVLTPRQQRTHTDLLAVTAPRPYAPPGLAAELAERFHEAAASAAAQWTERRLYLNKGALSAAHRCEAQSAAEAARGRDSGMSLPALVGVVSHRAVQIAHTHPGRAVGDYVDLALADPGDDAAAEAWSVAEPGRQSDVRQRAVDRVATFLDSWPPLREEWTPRFEHRLQARVGKVTLSARPDLALGRPRGDGKQSMLLADLKAGDVGDQHARESMFYALVATIANGVPPFRSLAYSLASGEHTDPDVTADRLRAAADWAADGSRKIVEVRTGQREATATPGPHCRWCPLQDSCDVANPEADLPDDGVLERWPPRRADEVSRGHEAATPAAAEGATAVGVEAAEAAASGDEPPSRTAASRFDFDIDDVDDE